MSIANKFLNFIGIGPDEIDEEPVGGYPNEPEMYENVSQNSRQSYDDYDDIYESGSKRNKVVKIHTTAQLKLVVMQPESFDEAREIAIHLKSKKPVVVNMESLDKAVMRRIVDFLSGAVFALDGTIQKVANGIFLIAPYNVGIMGDVKNELKNTGILSWNS